MSCLSKAQQRDLTASFNQITVSASMWGLECKETDSNWRLSEFELLEGTLRKVSY